MGKLFEPIYIKYLTPQENRRSSKDILIMKQNSTTKNLKVRMLFNVKTTREWLSREYDSIPTASLEAIFLTIPFNAYDGRDIMVLDVPSAFF